MTAEPVSAWLRPPIGGYTADDLDRIPDLPPHTELIDRSLVFASPQKLFHMLTVDLLTKSLRRWAPRGEFRVRREMSVLLGPRQRPEPDVIVVRSDADTGMDQTSYPPDAVVLAVEVVSPDSEERDRERKPQLYAKAGIKHFWCIEDASGKIALYTYELDPATHAYALTGIFHERVTLKVPFEIDIDLTEIDQL